MPDTGAPWNIPYVAGTDLVRDWPTDSQELAEAIADGLDAAGNAGIGTNVVQATKLDTFSTTSTSFTPVTGLSVTITPTTATSKILLIAQLHYGGLTDINASPALRINGGNADTYIAAAAGTRTRAATGTTATPAANRDVNKNITFGSSIVYLDSPATTSATTYNVEILSTGGTTVYVNQSAVEGGTIETVRVVSSITAIEVAA